MGNRSKFGVSTIIAVVASVVTIIVGGVTFWAQVAKPTAELGATVQYGTYRVDPWTGNDTRRLEDILKALNSYRTKGGKLSTPLNKFADDAFNVQFPRFPANGEYGYSRTTITDTGDLGAKNIALRIPNAVGSLVTLDDGSQKVASGSPTIDLGDLRPEQKIVVYSWFLSKPIFLSSGSDISLTYDGGIGSVNIQGQHGWAYNLLASTFMQIWLAIICLWLLAILWFTAYRLGYDAGKPESSSSLGEHKGSNTDQSSVPTDDSNP